MSEHVTKAYELGRRAVACNGWRWMPGMLLLPHVDGCECCEDRNFPRRAARVPAVFTTDIDVPDLSDPATLGCLLALVREATGQQSSASWFPGSKHDYAHWAWYSDDCYGKLCEGATEAECLVRVLESLARKVRHCDEITEERDKALRERDSFERQLARLQDAILHALVQRIEPRMSRHPVTVVQHAGSIIARIGEAMACQFEDGDDLVEAVKELVRERDEARDRAERLSDELESVAGAIYLDRESARGSLANEVRSHLFRAGNAYMTWEHRALRAERERDEARAEVEQLRADRDKWRDRYHAMRTDVGLSGDIEDEIAVAYRRGAEAMREACAREASVCANHRGEELADILSALPIPEEP